MKYAPKLPAIVALSSVSAFAPMMAMAQDAEPSAQDYTRALNMRVPLPQARPAPIQAPTSIQAPAPARVPPAAPPVQSSPVAREAATPAPEASSQQLTRSLNSREPAAQPRPVITRAAPAKATPVAPAPRPVAAPAPAIIPAQQAPTVRTDIEVPRAARDEARPVDEREELLEAPVVRRSEPVAAEAPVVVPAAAPLPRSGPLGAAAVAALPFRIDLMGAQIVERSSGGGRTIYSVVRRDQTLLMISVGASSDFPMFDGEPAVVAGRQSVLVTEGTRRRAVEHLFRSENPPQDLHIWLMAMDGEAADLAEQIGHTIEPRR